MLKLTRNDIIGMVSNVLNEIKNISLRNKKQSLLNEISNDEAYNRFYNNIPRDIYDNVMSGVNKMTPFHQATLIAVVDMLVHGAQKKVIDDWVDKIKMKFSNLDQQQRLYCVNYIKDNLLKDKKNINHFDINGVVRMSSTKVFVTKNKNAGNGLVVLFENEQLKITCTTTYAASNHYYGKTHWCTASGINGYISGYDSFRAYVKNASGNYCLVQFVFKNEKDIVYQIQFDESGNPLEVMDFNDNVEDFDRILEYADMYCENVFQKEILPQLPKMIELTEKGYIKEAEQMKVKLSPRANSIINALPNLPTREELYKHLIGTIRIEQLEKKIETEFPNGEITLSILTYSRKLVLFSLKQSTNKFQDYVFIRNTKEITNIDFKEMEYLWSFEKQEFIEMPEYCNDKRRKSLIYGNMLFSCGPRAAFDTKVFDTDTNKTTEYPCAFQQETSKNAVVFRNTDALYFFSKYDGTFLGSVTD